MPYFLVESSERVFYITRVFADTEAEALRTVYDGEVEIGDAVDGQDFQVASVLLDDYQGE